MMSILSLNFLTFFPLLARINTSGVYSLFAFLLFSSSVAYESKHFQCKFSLFACFFQLKTRIDTSDVYSLSVISCFISSYLLKWTRTTYHQPHGVISTCGTEAVLSQ